MVTSASRSVAFRSMFCVLLFAAGFSLFLACSLFSFAEVETGAPNASGRTRGDSTSEDAAARAKNLHQWSAVSLFHGLPSDRVRAIAQTADGVMWFGTDRGLARYDGRRIQAITNENLPSGRVVALKVEADGALWVGTESGAALYVNQSFREIKETAERTITSIITPEQGRAVLASDEGQIFDCRRGADGELKVELIPQEVLPSADVYQPGPLRLTSLTAHEGKVFIGTQSRGVMRIEDGAAKEIQSRPRAFFVNALETDAGGALWIGAKARRDEGGLFLAKDILRPQKIDAVTGPVTALLKDSGGNVWVGTNGHGAFRYQGTKQLDHFTFENTAGGLRSDNVYATFVDREGVVWFGTDRGVCRYDARSPRIEDVSADIQSNFVRALFRTKDGRLLCGSNRGLFVYNDKGASWKPVPGFETKTIYAIAEDNSGHLLVGTASGLFTNVNLERGLIREIPPPASEDDLADEQAPEQPAKKPEQRPNENARAIENFQSQTYVALFGRGVARIDGERRTIVWPSDSTDARQRDVTSLHADGNERLWIGTAESGVFIFDGKHATQDSELERLTGAPVWDIDGTKDAGLWFATARALYSYHTGNLRAVMQDTDARSIIVSADSAASTGSIWCATAGIGLLRIVNDAEFGTLISRLDVEQGLPSQSAFAILPLRAQDGAESLLIGTTRGVVRYSPGDALPLVIPARILSQRLHTTDELRAGISLDYPQNSLALDVAALSSRTFPEQFQYAFVLRDAKGRAVKQKLSHDSQFLMENLKPGAYRVEVRAFDKDLFSSAPLTFNFQIGKAPFPKTTLALSVLLALALLALLWAIIEHRRIKRTSTALARTNRKLASARLDLANEAERERRRIARDLHDQTLADLRHLLMLTDQIPVGVSVGGHTPFEALCFRSEIESVSNEIRRICEDLSPSVLENVGLTAALEWALSNAVAHAAPDCKFEYEFVCDDHLEDRLDLAPAVRMQVYRITQETLNNICRHSGASRVRMTVKDSEDSSLILTIEDDGQGFDPKKDRKGRGLTNIRARAQLIEAEAAWERSAAGGTIFTLRKPKASTSSAASG